MTEPPFGRADPLNRRAPRERGSVQRFLGGSVLGTVVKLAVVSILVGMAMNFFGWSPRDVLWALEDAVRGFWNAGFAALDSFLGLSPLGRGRGRSGVLRAAADFLPPLKAGTAFPAAR